MAKDWLPSEKMSNRPGVGSQSKNRRLIPQKLTHFFASFPDSYEFPALPDWLLRRPMGSVWCVPKSPQQQTHGAGRNTGRRNRIEPESNAQFLRRRSTSRSKKANKVADLTYKNTWSSFLKTSKSDQVTFFPIKSPPSTVEPHRPSVRFNQRRSWDDSAVLERQPSTDRQRKPLSSSPVRRRPSSMRTDSRKYSKLESKALREAWLNENVFPQFNNAYSASSADALASSAAEPPTIRTSKSSTYTLQEYVRPCPPIPPYRSDRRRGSVEANVSSATNDSFLTPGSMEMSGTSTLPTTSGSINVNATSSPTSSFDSMQARYSTRPTVSSPPERYSSRPTIRSPPARYERSHYPDDSLETTTSQSVEVQVSSTVTSSTSMQPHMSSESSTGYPTLCVNNVSASTMAREVLKRERAISSANSRKSCLKEGSGRKSRPTSAFKDPSRLEWTKRYLYTILRTIVLRYCHLTKELSAIRLAPPTQNNYYHDRSSSMSRVSSYDPRDFQVYTVQQRPWQSSPDLRMQKWKPTSLSNLGLNTSSVDGSLDVVELMKRKKQFLAQLLQEKTAEEDSYRSLKRDTRSLALLQSATLPRCLSAGRSIRSSDHSAQYSAGYGSDELARWKTSSSNSSRNTKKVIPDYGKSHDLLTRDLDFRKKQNLTTTARPFHFSSENLLPSDKFSYMTPEPTEKSTSYSNHQMPRKKVPTPSSARHRSPEKRPRSSVKFNALQSFTAPLQPASGENKASVLRRTLTKKKCEEQMAHSWQQQERERERRHRLRAIRLDPAWMQVRGGDQALEDIAHRRCYKEVVERERLLQYYMDKEEMLNRVWQMPPLFERQAMAKRELHPSGPQVFPDRMPSTSMSVNATSTRSSGPSGPSGGARKKTSFRTGSKTEESLDCYMASESLQLSRPSTAKSSTKSNSACKRD